MPPEILDTASRALTTGRSRRIALGAFFATAVAATLAGENEARKRKKRTTDKNKKGKNRSKGKNKSGTGGGCTVRHSEQEILNFISAAAKQYGQSENAMVRVARCESTLNPCALNPAGPYYGLFQFLKSTWKGTPYGDRDIYDPEAQALATAWMWKEGRKDEWVCQ